MNKKKHFSTFSGVGGFDLALERTGKFETVAFVEKDPYCCSVLETHWPGKPIYRDIREVAVEEIKEKFGTIDLLTGGFPCQDLSVAGNREGLSGKRSGLWFEFHRLIEGLHPEWVIVENVPGLLSSNKGRDFAVLLRGLGECGYGVAYRILDAQYFGVPQRRRRVFIVGHFGDGRAAEVLFEREGMFRDPPSRSSAEQEVAGTLKGGSGERGWSDPSDGNGGGLVSPVRSDIFPERLTPDEFRRLYHQDFGPFWDGSDLSDTIDLSSVSKQQMMPEKHRFPVVIQHSTINRKDEAGAQGKGVRDDDTTWTLDGRGDPDVVAYDEANRPETYKQNVKGDFSDENPEVASTLSAYRSSQHRQVVIDPAVYKEHGGNGIGENQGVAGPVTAGAGVKHGGKSLVVYENHAQDSRITASEDISPTLPSHMGTGGNNVPLVEGFDARNLETTGDVSQTVQSKKSGGYSLNYLPTVVETKSAFAQNEREEVRDLGDKAGAVQAERATHQQTYIALQADGSGLEVTTDGTTPTVLHGGDGREAHGAYRKLAAVVRATIRRFTPLETERLQGFPDGWTAVPNKKHRSLAADDFEYMRQQLEAAWGREVSDGEVCTVAADSHRYRQMGNAVAIPPVQWIALRLARVCDTPAPVMPDLRDLLASLGQGEQLSLF